MSDHNPWLDVTVEDYLGHMGSEAVGQLPALRDLFAAAVRRYAPRRLLVLGCGMGDGFDLIDPAVTERVTGVEINPGYLERLRDRFREPPFSLDLICRDAAGYPIPEGSFDLVYAALLFEYLPWRRVLPGIAASVRPGGGVAVVVQLPSESAPAVSETPFQSVRVLDPLFQFVDPAALVEAFDRLGLGVEHREEVPLPQGKAFAVVHFRKG